MNKNFGFLGILSAMVPILILPYYSVIGGWVMKYMTAFATGEANAAAGTSYFGDFTSQTWSPLFFFFLFLTITVVVVALGVQKGVELVSKIMMPVLVLLTIFIACYVTTIDNAWEGIKYYLLPDFSKFSFKTLCAAMGQLFYSMSIAMGIMVAYGSYVKDEVNLNKSVNHIEFFDTLIAMLSGFMIVPVVYVFEGQAGLKASGPGLMFQTLPKVFERMPLGNIIGLVFFILVFLAAVTSSISLMEAIVSMFMDKFKLKRGKAVAIIYAISLALGIPSSIGFGLWKDIKPLGMDFLTFFDYISNSVLMPIVALFTCILIGWFVGTKVLEDEITKNGEPFGRRHIFRVMIKYIAPVFLVVILVFYSLAQFGIISF